MVKSACDAGDLGLIPGLGRSSGVGNGNPLQYSCLGNPMDGGACQATVHGVTKSRTQLSDFTFFFLYIYPFFFRFFSHIGYYKIFSRVSYAIQQVFNKLSAPFSFPSRVPIMQILSQRSLKLISFFSFSFFLFSLVVFHCFVYQVADLFLCII